MSPTLSERFEMRLDPATVAGVDAWRSKQSDLPSRAEAMRRLIERGLEGAGEGPVTFSRGETLLLHLMSDLFKHQKIKSELDPSFIKEALHGGHLWGLEWEYPGLFHSHQDKYDTVQEVVSILEMWDFLEGSYKNLTAKQKQTVKNQAQPFGEDATFRGFDGTNETDHIGVARFLVESLGRFSRFKGRDLNCHYPSIDTHHRMLEEFLPMRNSLRGRDLSDAEIIQILKARAHPSRGK